MDKIRVSIGKHPDEMGFGECMAHVRRVLFWDPVDGQWTDTDFLRSAEWDRLAGYVTDAHERENAELRELARDLRFCARQSICLKCRHGRVCDLRIDERCAELGIEVDR